MCIVEAEFRLTIIMTKAAPALVDDASLPCYLQSPNYNFCHLLWFLYRLFKTPTQSQIIIVCKGMNDIMIEQLPFN